ncbi:MAG: ArnT family glycosyltransferase [Gemmatimonas sp.]
MNPRARSASLESASQEFSPPTAGALAIGVLVMHIVTNIITPYGFHRDEFLYLAMGDHLQLWRMDFPPFIAIVAKISKGLFGASLPGIRLAPAFAHAGVVLAAMYATWVFGGRRSAQMLTGLGIALCPYFLRAGAMLQPVVFDQLWWTLALLAISIRIQDGHPKHWIGTGIFLGLAALTKFSVAFIAAGFLVALLVTTLRNDLKSPWPWTGAIIATVIGHPSITGQILLGWPIRGQFADLEAEQLSHVSRLSFITEQFAAGPVLILAVWGIVWLFRSGRGEPAIGAPSALRPDYRPVAVIPASAFVILLVMRGKSYYIAPIYPILTAAGAAALDAFSARISPKRPSKVLAVAAAAVALYGMVTLPFGLPVLAPQEMLGVSRVLGQANKTNTGESIALPQDYADMLGWQRLVDVTARAWNSLPPADTADAVLIGTNYGRAGALDLLGPELGLPPSVSPAGSYWFWGPGKKSGAVAVIPTDDPEAIRKMYSECKLHGQTANPWGVAEEQSVQVYVCRGARMTIQDVWPSLAGRN